MINAVSDIIEGGACPFCLATETANLRLTKKGKPWFHCEACGTRAFIHTQTAAETFRWILSSGIQFARIVQGLAAKPSVQSVPQNRGISA